MKQEAAVKLREKHRRLADAQNELRNATDDDVVACAERLTTVEKESTSGSSSDSKEKS